MNHQFNVEATLHLDVPSNVNPKNRKAVRDWLIGTFFYYEDNYSISGQPGGPAEIVVRVQTSVDIDLSRVTGANLLEQLRVLHRLAKEQLAADQNIQTDRVWGIDVLISD